jgi:hypothetical protein
MTRVLLSLVFCCLSLSAFSEPLPTSEIEDVVWRLRRSLQMDLYRRTTPHGPQVIVLTKIPIVWVTTKPVQVLFEKLHSLLATQNNQVDPNYNIYHWESLHPMKRHLPNLGLMFLDYGVTGYALYQILVNRDPDQIQKLMPYMIAFSLVQILSYGGGYLFKHYDDQPWFKFPFFAYYFANTHYLKSGMLTVAEILENAKQPGGIVLLTSGSRHYKRLPEYLQKIGFQKWEPAKD